MSCGAVDKSSLDFSCVHNILQSGKSFHLSATECEDFLLNSKAQMTFELVCRNLSEEEWNERGCQNTCRGC